MRARLVAIAALVGTSVTVCTSPAFARSAVLTPVVEAWYTTATQCASAVPCAVDLRHASPPSAGDALHVGAVAGREDARTYLVFDLDSISEVEAVDKATLHLPIEGAESGTIAPELARIVACPAIEAVPAVLGSDRRPPAVDCAVTAVAVPDDDSRGFAVDLGAILEYWSTADITGAVALLPGVAAPTDTWRVAMPRRPEQPTDPPGIRMSVTMREHASMGEVDVDAASTAGAVPPSTRARPVAEASGAIRASATDPSTSASLAGPVWASEPLGRRFAYPVATIVPLLVLVGAAATGRTFSTPVRRRPDRLNHTKEVLH